jgi:hypothetical protein
MIPGPFLFPFKTFEKVINKLIFVKNVENISPDYHIVMISGLFKRNIFKKQP